MVTFPEIIRRRNHLTEYISGQRNIKGEVSMNFGLKFR
jgi:hypothetical protein